MGNLLDIGFSDLDSLTPLFLTSLIAFFWISGKWKEDKILMVTLIASAICWIFIANRNVEIASIGTDVTYFILVVYSSFFRKRGCI